MSEPVSTFQNAGGAWSQGVFDILKEGGIEVVPFVPDGGLRALIEHCQAEPTMQAVTLSTEEEGVALVAGAWLGGKRSALLMQSSGVGNCVNMLSVLKVGQFPLLMLITMRGEWGEFNPWQVPMGQATPAVLAAMGVLLVRSTDPAELPGTVEAALRLAYSTYSPVAVLISQQLLGSKTFGGTK